MNNNRDCRPVSRVRGVGDGTCIYNQICTRGVGDGRGNNSCYTPSHKTDKIDTFSSNESNLVDGLNITVIVNAVLIILILMILYKVYNPSITYF